MRTHVRPTAYSRTWTHLAGNTGRVGPRASRSLESEHESGSLPSSQTVLAGTKKRRFNSVKKAYGFC